METGVRIAMSLGSINDSVSRESYVLALEDMTIGDNKHRVLRVSGPNGDWLPVKDANTDDIEDLLNNIISRPQKDDVFVSDLDKDFSTEVGQVITNTITTPSYYRRIKIAFRTEINMDEVVVPLNKLEEGYAVLKIVDKRGVELVNRRFSFYDMTGGDYKSGMIIGSEDDDILFDQSFDEPVKATFEYSIPVGQYRGKNEYSEVRVIPCLKKLVIGFRATRQTLDEPHDPSLQFICMFDNSGNYTYGGTDVINQFKAYYREHYEEMKPYIVNVKTDGVNTQLIPWLSEHMVFTELTFEGEQFRDVGKLIEKMMNVIVRDQNNIFVRMNTLYKNTTKFIKKHLEDNAVQEVMLLDIWGQLADLWSHVLSIEEWIPLTDILKPNPINNELDLTKFDSEYMYKYKIVPDENKLYDSNSSSHWEPVIEFHGYSPTDNSHMEGVVASSGQLMNGFISKSELTEYTRREVRTNETLANCAAQGYSFGSDPLTPVTYTGPMMGDADNLYRTLSGSVTCKRRSDVPVDAYVTYPWIQMQIDCYNVAGTLVKTVNAVFSNSGSQRQPVNFNGSDLTFNWTANLGGAYRYKYKLMCYWGTFGAWTDEVQLCYWGLDRGNNSGGTWRINQYIFNNQSNRVLTRCQLHDASKYEKNVIINGKGYGWGGNVTPNIDWDDNGTFGAPGSANYWYASFYGKIFEKPGCDFICKDYHNVGVSGTRDMKNSLHYGSGQAATLSVMTTATVNATSGVGDKAYYVQDKYKTPSFYFPDSGEYSILIRGARRYQFVTSLPVQFLQYGTFQVDVDTYNMDLNNTAHYGQILKKTQDIVIQGNKSSYKIAVLGTPDSQDVINSGAPNKERRATLVRSKRSVGDKPENESGVGELTIIPIPYGRLFDDGENHNLYVRIEGTQLTFALEIRLIITDYTEYQEIYNYKNIRVYMKIVDSDVYFMTYQVGVKRIEIIAKTDFSLSFNFMNLDDTVAESYPLTKEKNSEKALAFDIKGKEYYLNLSKEAPQVDEPTKILDKDNRIVGYLTK